jgi:hypothetical protein
MIALGKQRDSVFTTDGQGSWKLVEDPTPSPAPTPKTRKKPGRKPGSGKAAKAAKAAPARSKRASGRPRGRPPKKSASADKEGSAFPQEIEETTDNSTTVLRVKRGQTRKEALLTPKELEARRQAATAVDTMQFRWDSSSRSERERMRRNLFGDFNPKMN